MASRPDIGPTTFSSLPPFGRPPLESLAGRAALSRELVRTVDRQPETRGLGVVLIDGRQLCRLRPQGNSGATVVYELRARPSMAMVGSRNTPTTPSHPLPAASVRTHTTSVSAEWIGLGFNCGGAVLAWIGVVGTGALAPVTGGASAIGTVVMWGGAIASTGSARLLFTAPPTIIAVGRTSTTPWTRAKFTNGRCAALTSSGWSVPVAH